MSVASPKSSEPSMEEILASIRKIIADDQPAPAAAEKPAPQPAPAPAPAPRAEAVRAEPARAEPVAPVAKPAVAPAPPPSASDDVLDLGDDLEPLVAATPPDDDIMFVDREDEPELPPPPAMPPPAIMPAYQPPQIDAGLLSAQTDAAVSSAFQSLAGTILAGSQRTLDDVVKDLLRPMLKMWLDDNLPTIVERLVRAEIERVARGGR